MPNEMFTSEVQTKCIDKAKEAGDAVSEVIRILRHSDFHWPFPYDDEPNMEFRRGEEVLDNALSALKTLYDLQNEIGMIILPVTPKKSKEPQSSDDTPL